MALGKTGASAIAYTPFNKTSFGYGSGEITAAHSSLTNVKVVITPQTSTHWDATGHISTVGSGSAVASYNKDKFEWSCSGPIADVDAVLDNLDFFPADYPAVRNWTTKAIKPNETDGNFPIHEGVSEEPASDNPIPDTDFDLKVYDLSTNSLVASYTVTFDAIQPTFGKQRPYWSTEPSNEDLATADHALTTGGLLDFGVIAQGSDTDPLTITCEFRTFGSSSPHTGNIYGQFPITETNIFIGDKKPSTIDNNTKRLNFTGTKEEVQSYLNNIRYNRSLVGGNNIQTFEMFMTISNGVVGSTLTKYCWFSDNTILVPTISALQYTEDGGIANWDFGNLSITDTHQDSESFKAEITLGTIGKGGVDVFGSSSLGTNTTAVYDTTTGVLTVVSDTKAKLLTALRFLEFTPETDFSDTFDILVDFTFTSLTTGSTYVSAQQTVSVTTIAHSEIEYHNTNHTYVEDTPYDFSNGDYPQILHPHNETFQFTFTLPSSAGTLGITNTGTGATFSGSSPTYTLTGLKTQVNTALSSLYYSPALDYNSTHTINFSVDRITPSNQEHDPVETGSFVMTSTNVAEYIITQPANIDWFTDNSVTFDSGLAISDTSSDYLRLLTHGNSFTIEIAMWYYNGSAWVEHTDGTIVSNHTNNLVKSGAGNQNGQGDTNMISYTGPKDDINTALTDLKYIPDCGTTTAPRVFYKLIRNSSPSATFTDQTNTTATTFNPGNTADFTYTTPSDITWIEDTEKDFDSGLVITDGAALNSGCSVQFGSTYTATIKAYYWNGSAHIALTTATWSTTVPGSATVTGNGKSATPLVITGDRDIVNTAIANLRMTPDMDWITSPAGDDKFYIYIDVVRDLDSFDIVTDYVALNSGNNVYVQFAEGTSAPAYHTSVTGMTYNEDTPKTIFNGLEIGVSETATSYISGITYEVTVELSDAGAGEWTGTNSHIKTLTTDTANNVNTELQSLEFTPTIDYSTDFNIIYSQTRYQTIASGSFVVGTTYTIKTIGTTDFTLIGASANTIGVTFTTTGIGAGTGTADIITVQATQQNIGTVDGVQSPLGDYTTAITPVYVEDNFPGFISSYTGNLPNTSINYPFWPNPGVSDNEVKITDIAADNYPNISYWAKIEISPSNAGNIHPITNHINEYGGYLDTYGPPTNLPWTKHAVNGSISVTYFDPAPDFVGDIDIIYSQKRYQTIASGSFVVGTDYIIKTVGTTDFTLIGASANTIGTVFTATGTGTGDGDAVFEWVQATDVTIGTMTVEANIPEYTYGTSNSNIQYFVDSDDINGVDLSQSEAAIKSGAADVILTPRQITENKGLTYDRPITITDLYGSGRSAPSQYKVVFSGGTLFAISGVSLNVTDTGWLTKSDLHTILDNGIYVTGFNSAVSRPHDSIYTVNFTVYRKIYSGVESSIATGQLTYQFKAGMQIWMKNKNEYGAGTPVDFDRRVDAASGTVYGYNHSLGWMEIDSLLTLSGGNVGEWDHNYFYIKDADGNNWTRDVNMRIVYSEMASSVDNGIPGTGTSSSQYDFWAVPQNISSGVTTNAWHIWPDYTNYSWTHSVTGVTYTNLPPGPSTQTVGTLGRYGKYWLFQSDNLLPYDATTNPGTNTGKYLIPTATEGHFSSYTGNTFIGIKCWTDEGIVASTGLGSQIYNTLPDQQIKLMNASSNY